MPIGPFLQHDHSFDPEDIANMSAGFEAALGKLGVVSRDNRAKVAIAKMIIEVAKEGERDPARLCEEAVKGSRSNRGGQRKIRELGRMA